MGRSSWKLAAALLCTAAAAFALGQRNGTSARTAAAPTAAAPAARPVLIERTSGLDRDELRAIVREELSQHQVAARSEGAEEGSEAAQAESTERQARRAEALMQASQVVERGIADGVWSIEEREALRAQLPALGEREIHAVLSPLFQAINAQRLTLDGPPI